MTVSERLRKRFDLNSDTDHPGWPELAWAVRCTLTGILPVRKQFTPQGMVSATGRGSGIGSRWRGGITAGTRAGYGNSSGYDCAEARPQRHSLILAGDTNATGQRAPLEYLIEACIEVQGDIGPRGGRGGTPRWNAMQTLAKYHQMFLRRAAAGQCFYQPFLGCREFSVAEWQIEKAGFDAALPQGLPDDQFGPVFRDFDFGAFWDEWRSPQRSDKPVLLQARKFNAQAERGQIRVAHRRDANIPCSPRSPEPMGIGLF